MLELIKTYTKSCIMAEQRIKYLTVKLNELKRNGSEDTEEYTDLQRRIRLLYIERTEMLEVIQILESYQKRRNANA